MPAPSLTPPQRPRGAHAGVFKGESKAEHEEARSKMAMASVRQPFPHCMSSCDGIIIIGKRFGNHHGMKLQHRFDDAMTTYHKEIAIIVNMQG